MEQGRPAGGSDRRRRKDDSIAGGPSTFRSAASWPCGARAVMVCVERMYAWGLAIARDASGRAFFIDHRTCGVPLRAISSGQLLRIMSEPGGYAYWAVRP
jgi:hypothetical protein